MDQLQNGILLVLQWHVMWNTIKHFWQIYQNWTYCKNYDQVSISINLMMFNE